MNLVEYNYYKILYINIKYFYIYCGHIIENIICGNVFPTVEI